MIVAITEPGWVQCKSLKAMESDINEYGKGSVRFEAEDKGICRGWKKLFYLPPSFLPCIESGIAISDEGELAFVGGFGK